MCAKEGDGIGKTTHAGNSEETELILNKIQRFRLNYASPSAAKSLVEYTTTEVEQIVEGAFNWGTADPDAKFGELLVDTFSTTVSFFAGTVKEADLLAAYADLEAAMHSIPLVDQDKLHLMDVESKVENNELLLTAYRITSRTVPGPTSSSLNTNFIYQYRANTYNPGCSVHKADLGIQDRINNAIGLLPNIYTVVDVQRWQVLGGVELYPGYSLPFQISDIPNRKIASSTFPNPNDPNGLSPIWYPGMTYDYLVYLTPLTNPMPPNTPLNACLDATAMSYLTQSAYDLMTTIRNTYVQNNQLVPISATVKSFHSRQEVLNPADIRHRLGHNITYTFGRVILNGGTPG